MFAAKRISKLQAEKNAQSARSRPQSAPNKRPQSATSRQRSLEDEAEANDNTKSIANGTKTTKASASKSVAKQRPWSADDTAPVEPGSSGVFSQIAQSISRSGNKDPVAERHRTQSSSEEDLPRVLSNYSSDSDEPWSESVPETPRSDTSTPRSHSAQNAHSRPTSPKISPAAKYATDRRRPQSAKKPKRPVSRNRPKSGGRRKSRSSNQRRASTSSQKRPARRMENKYARRLYKEEVLQAKKPDLQGTCMEKCEALWIMFVMSFVPKILTAVGLIICLLGVIMLSIGSNVEANYPQGKPAGAVMFVLGLGSVVIGLVALKMRRNEKKKMRGLATKQAREKYENGVLPTKKTEIATISGRVDIVKDIATPPRVQKTSFTVIQEDSGFTNLAALADDYHLPGSPRRKRRWESVEATMKELRSSSPDLRGIPEVLAAPRPTSGKRTKSHGGKNVKKSKARVVEKQKLSNVPEVIVSPDSDENVTGNGGLEPNPNSTCENNKEETCSSGRSTPTVFKPETKASTKDHDKTPTSSPQPRNRFSQKNRDDDSRASAQRSKSRAGVAMSPPSSPRDAVARQNDVLQASYKNVGFDNDDIVPEDLD